MHIQALEPPVPAPFAAASSRHILLVIHDQEARYAVADMLLDADFRLTLASSYTVADMLLHNTGGFDLMVAEATMPALSGTALAKLARQTCPGMPVLLLDGLAAAGPGVLDTAVQMMDRWPVKPRYDA